MKSLIAVFNPNEWGTVWEWTVGILIGVTTAVFAGLAWWQAKMAAGWAKKAVEAEERAATAQEHANRLAEMSVVPTFNVAFSTFRKDHPEDDPVWGLTFSVADDSPAVWIHEASAISLRLVYCPDTDGTMPEPPSAFVASPTKFEWFGGFDQLMPYQLRPMVVALLIGINPYEEQFENARIGDGSYMFVAIRYSLTGDGEIHDAYNIAVDLTERIDCPHEANSDGE
jgi:hypothetical protein